MQFKSFMEALKGKQHKIDKNKNGQIDAHDFQLLRKEETEQTDESFEFNRAALAKQRLQNLRHSGRKVRGASVANLMRAAGIREEEMDETDLDQLDEVLAKDATASDWIHDFVHSTNPKFEGKSKKERIKMALGAYYGQAKEKQQMEAYDSPLDTPEATKAREDLKKTLLDIKKKDPKHPAVQDVKEAVQKADVPAYLRKQQGQAPLKLSDLKRKDTISDKDNLAKLRNEEKDDVPFDPPYKKVEDNGTTTDKSGAQHTPMSKARHLARQALKKQMKEDVEQIDEISLDTMKSAKEKLGRRAYDAHMDDNKYAAQHYAGRALKMGSKIKQKERAGVKEDVEHIEEGSEGIPRPRYDVGPLVDRKSRPTGYTPRPPVTNPKLAPVKKPVPPPGANFKKSVAESVLDRVRAKVSGEIEQGAKERQALSSARNQAAIDRERNHAADHAAASADTQHFYAHQSKAREDNHAAKLERDKIQQAHYNKQRDKINNAFIKKVRKEEVELEDGDELQELNRDTLKSYINKAKPQMLAAKDERQSARDAGDWKTAGTAGDTVNKRREGITTAKARLNKEETETSEKHEMAQTQLHFIKYAAEEILEYIDMGGQIEEWYQNKLSKVQSEVESLHSYIEGESRRTGMKEEVSSTGPVNVKVQIAGNKPHEEKWETAKKKQVKEEYDEEGNITYSKVTFKDFSESLVEARAQYIVKATHKDTGRVKVSNYVADKDESQYSVQSRAEREHKPMGYRVDSIRRKDVEAHGEGDEDETNSTTQKRGRGRPAGAKSGARGPRIK